MDICVCVNVKEISQEGRNFSLGKVDARQRTIRELKVELQNMGLGLGETVDHVKLIFEGRILSDSELLQDAVKLRGGVQDVILHAICGPSFYPSPQPQGNSSFPSSSSGPRSRSPLPKLDAQSEQAAFAYLAQGNSQGVLSPERHAQLVCALASLTSSSQPRLVSSAAAPLPRAGGRPGAPPEPRLRLFDPVLLVRIIIGFFLFTNGASPVKTLFFSVMGIVYYIVEVGFVAAVVKRFLAKEREAHLLQAQAAQGQPLVVGQAQQPPRNPNAAPQTYRSMLRSALVAMLTTGLKIPTGPGFLLDIWSFAMALVMSLFPSWRPI